MAEGQYTVTVEGPGFFVRATRTRDEDGEDEDCDLDEQDLFCDVVTSALTMVKGKVSRNTAFIAELVVNCCSACSSEPILGFPGKEEQMFIKAAEHVLDGWREHDDKRDAEENKPSTPNPSSTDSLPAPALAS